MEISDLKLADLQYLLDHGRDNEVILKVQLALIVRDNLPLGTLFTLAKRGKTPEIAEKAYDRIIEHPNTSLQTIKALALASTENEEVRVKAQMLLLDPYYRFVASLSCEE
jgi:hypothetical protein